MENIGLLASVLIGISIGLIGGGGSILAMPILVYLFKVNPENATSYSLFIVGFTSMIGSFFQYRLGNLKIKFALLFGIPSIASLLFMRKFLLPLLPKSLFYISNVEVTKNLLIMVVFAILMLATSFSFIKKNSVERTTTQPNNLLLISVGTFVGFLIGFLGAGGGFLIVPALLYFGNLPIKKAIGTSLFIIFINSLIGFSADVIADIPIDFKLLFQIVFMALLGLIIGTYLSKKIDGKKLKPLIGWFILVMGIYILVKELILN